MGLENEVREEDAGDPPEEKEEHIKPLGFKLRLATVEEYNKARVTFIADIYSVQQPQLGEIKWNEMYPNGFYDWQSSGSMKLSAIGQQRVLDKIDEIIKFINDYC